MANTRILVMMDPSPGWARDLLQGVNQVALEHGWVLVLYSPLGDLEWLLRAWEPSAVIVGPHLRSPLSHELSGRLVVGANLAGSTKGLPSIGTDDRGVGELAADHLLSKGLRHFSTFSFEARGWARERVEAFRKRIAASGVEWHPDGWLDAVQNGRPPSEAEAIPRWLHGLPKPCGVFACCDTWARVVACYCRATGLRLPEDIALIGADNDPIECELTAPALSSVAIPWTEMGREVALLVRQGLERPLAATSNLLAPTHVAARRSTDILAVDEPLVAAAVTWIHQHSDQQLAVADVVRAAKTYRQKLEKRFRAVLGRSVMEEVRRSRIERAKRLLAMTDLPLPDVAMRSGFTNASLLSVAFRRETRTTPGAFRRRAKA